VYYPLPTNLLPRDIEAKYKSNTTLERKDCKGAMGDINREAAKVDMLEGRGVIDFEDQIREKEKEL
jgi:hypothetical protein